MKVRELPPTEAHHLMVEAIRAKVLPRLDHLGEPKRPEFEPRTAWSLFNAFTEVPKGAPRAQMEGSLRLSALFRRELQIA